MTYITKEQFGVELYEAITACAATEQIQRQLAHAQATKKPSAVKRLEVIYQNTKDEAIKRVTDCPCSDKDAAELVRRYPWIMQ